MPCAWCPGPWSGTAHNDLHLDTTATKIREKNRRRKALLQDQAPNEKKERFDIADADRTEMGIPYPQLRLGVVFNDRTRPFDSGMATHLLPQRRKGPGSIAGGVENGKILAAQAWGYAMRMWPAAWP